MQSLTLYTQCFLFIDRWVPESTPSMPLTAAWGLIDMSIVQWAALPGLIPSLLAMIVVVGFSSCLDVAAIEMELSQPLDYNRELVTVGVGNVLSGLTGGFTGRW